MNQSHVVHRGQVCQELLFGIGSAWQSLVFLERIVYRSKMKQAFIRATSDYNPVVRGDGARGLGTLGDTDVIPLLEKLARDDPAFLPHQADEGKDLYFVRLEAQRALAQIRSKSKKPD